MNELSAVNIFTSIKGDKTEFAFTRVESPHSEADILFSVLVPSVNVGRFFLDLRQMIDDQPELFGFTKK